MGSPDAGTTGAFHIGLATTDITPPVGTLLVGYSPRRSTSTAHPLRAEALVCRQGARAWALVTSDTLGYLLEDVTEIRARIQRRTGLPPEAVMISATHTHSGPPTTLAGGIPNDLDLQYLAELKDRLADLVEKAWHAATPARFEAAWTSARDLISNRRVQTAEGSWTNVWEDPEGKHTGYADPAVLVVGVRTAAAGNLAGLLVNFGCHPVTLGGGSFETSPDYPGYMRDHLEASLPGCTALFTLSGAANIDPRVACRTGREYPSRMGEALAGTVSVAVPHLAPLENGPLGYGVEPWEMIRTKDAPKALGRQIARQGETVRTQVQVFTAGQLMIVGLPGELFSEFALPLRQMRRGYTTMVVSMANDFVGYLPTDEAQRQGAYEPTWAPVEQLEKALLDRAANAMDKAILAATTSR